MYSVNYSNLEFCSKNTVIQGPSSGEGTLERTLTSLAQRTHVLRHAIAIFDKNPPITIQLIWAINWALFCDENSIF